MLTTEEKIAMIESDIDRHEYYIEELKRQLQNAKKQLNQKPFPVEVSVQNHPGQLLSE